MGKILKIKLLSFIVFSCFCFNVHGQNTYIGKISGMPDPRTDIPSHYFDWVYSFITISGEYLLTVDSFSLKIWDDLIVGDTKYFSGEIVTITGTTIAKQGSFLEEYYELEIETIERNTLEQDVQRFLGTYVVEGICSDSVQPQHFFPIQGEIILSGLPQNELLFYMTGYLPVDGFYTFVSEDSLFIPAQWGTFYPDGAINSFSGKGKMENDSMFFNIVYGHYGYDFSKIIFTTCNCKGKRADPLNIVPLPESPQNKVYYDAATQVIVIDKTLQNQFFTLELYDMQGRSALRKTDIGNAVSIANLPNGLYLYRVLENHRAIYSGKVLKNK